MVSRLGFTLLVALIGIQRLAELAHSRRNEAWLRASGGVEHAPCQARILAWLHGAWLVSMLAEVWLSQPSFRLRLALLASLVFGVGQLLRLTAIRTLGSRWTVSVITLPGTPRVTKGPYSWMRHPNYIGVAFEIAALPLVHGAVVTAVVFSVLNAIALVLRIDVESRALEEAEPWPNPTSS
jgi:methyltransferase